MKATGIVRRIDELGRVVIPKEIRRTQRIRPGDPLEIFTAGEGEVIFRKYSPMQELADHAAGYCEVLARSLELTVLVCDRDKVVAAAGPGKRVYAGQRISRALEEAMQRRSGYLWGGRAGEKLYPCEEADRHLLAMYPVLANGDLPGAVCALSGSGAGADRETARAVELAAQLLAKQLEE